MDHPLFPLLQCPGVRVNLVVRHTGDVDDVETVQLCENTNEHGPIELCDGLYTVHDREADADLTILRRLNRGELSGTHVFPMSTGFAHWHLDIHGDIPALRR